MGSDLSPLRARSCIAAAGRDESAAVSAFHTIFGLTRRRHLWLDVDSQQSA